MSSIQPKLMMAALAMLIASMSTPFAFADVTSPMVKDRGRKYTEEKPQTTYYGSGAAGRMTEASELRYHAESLLSAGEWEKAIPIIKRAVQFDAGDPSGHLILARALTQKFYHTKGAIDEKLLTEALREWQLIRYHDADPTEQWEAGMAAKKLIRVAKALEKQKIEQQKLDDAKLLEQLAAKKPNADGKFQTATVTGKRKIAEKLPTTLDAKSDDLADADNAKSGKDTDGDDTEVKDEVPSGQLNPELKQLTMPKKRFGIF